MLRAAAVAVFALLVAAAPAGAQAPRDWLGVVADGPLTDPAADREREWDLVGRSGAATIRTAFYWWDGQPAGPGAVDFSAYDRVVLAAARRGLRTLPIVHGTPAWARSRGQRPRAGRIRPRRRLGASRSPNTRARRSTRTVTARG